MPDPEAAFDPRGVLAALDRHRVAYIIIGAFARVVQGADEVTHGIDIVPSTQGRTCAASTRRSRRSAPAAQTARPSFAGADGLEPVVQLTTDRGELKVIPEPQGTRGYEDLRRAATREHIGQGLRPAVASLGDLSRMLASLGHEDDMPKLLDLRRLAELEISHGIEI